MTDRKEIDIEKIKAELAESASMARKKIADSAKSYRDAMDKLAGQIKKIKDRK